MEEDGVASVFGSQGARAIATKNVMIAKTLLPPEVGIRVGVKVGHARDQVSKRGLPFVWAGGCKDSGEVSQFCSDFSGDESG